MDILQLQYFCAVAKLQHMTKAAEEVNISQSALSQSITRLEEELGVRLFERYGRSIRLNAYGAAYLTEVEAALASLERGRQLLRNMQIQSDNSVTIMAPTLLGFPNLMAHISNECKQINISVFNCPVEQVVCRLKNGEADLCILPALLDNAELSSQFLRMNELGVLVASTHPLAGKTVSFNAFRDEIFTTFTPGNSQRLNFDNLCAHMGWKPTVMLEVDNYSDIARAVGTGEYVATTVRAIYENYPGAHLSFVTLEEEARFGGLMLYWERNRKQKPIVRMVKACIIDYFANNP